MQDNQFLGFQCLGALANQTEKEYNHSINM